MPNWYSDSFLLLHYDRHYSSSDVRPGSGLDAEQLRRVLQQVRPDAVTCYAKGYPGYVPFPTRFSNQLHDLLPAVAGESAPDILAIYREVTRELGIRFVVAFSGLIDHQAADWRPGWLRIRSDYSPYPNRALCPNSGYVEDLLLPQLDELVERYRPDGIWMDAENWTVSPCYCATCESEYYALQERSAPRERGDAFWEDWLAFQRTTFRRYLSRVSLYLHSRGSELVVASNGTYSTHQAETMEEAPDRLSRDLSPAYSLRQAGMEARFFDRTGIPFDLLTWNRCSPRPWSQGRLPAIPAYAKTFDHLAQEGAVILASGGRWNVWLTAYPDDSLPERQHEIVASAAAFARERQPWCQGTESAAWVAVLHSDATHRKAGNGLYDPGPSLDRVRGAHQLLTELHQLHDIVNEDRLYREINRYQVVILPEQIALPPDLDALLEEWVAHGGRLIASGKVAPRNIEEIPTFALESVLGVRWTGGQETEGVFLLDGQPLQIGAPVYRVSVEGAESLIPQATSTHEMDPGVSEHPAVTRNTFHEGESYYIAADFFAGYHRCQYPGFRAVLGKILTQAIPELALETTAPPTVEIVARERGTELIVHLIQHAPGKSLAQNSAFVESVPLTEPFQVSVSLGATPASVRLQPGDLDVEWGFEDGLVTADIPPFAVHSILVIEAAVPGEAGVTIVGDEAGPPSDLVFPEVAPPLD